MSACGAQATSRVDIGLRRPIARTRQSLADLGGAVVDGHEEVEEGEAGVVDGAGADEGEDQGDDGGGRPSAR
jgi:hypothetical protein